MADSKLYADRDHMELGDYYTRHVSAMTAEGLHAKSDIAAELAWRDREIARLRALSPAGGDWVMVPHHIHVSADAWESLAFHFGGPATGEGEEYMDCTLWIGDIENDDGSKSHGLHLSCDECPEEGSATVAEFPRAAMLAASPQQEPGAGDGGPQCSTHPDAPHGFDRNGSHNNGRYKCDCEGWTPPSRLEEAAALLGRARLALNEGECDLHYHDERGVRRSLVERIDSYLSRECGNA